MRICYISHGAFGHIDPYLEYFRQAGHDVHLLCLTPGPERQVPTYNLGFGRKYSNTEGKWKYPFSMLAARRLIKKIRPDIVHAHYATSAGLAALVCGFHPSIVTAHGSDLIVGMKSKIWRPILKRIFNFADCVNVVSQQLCEMTAGLGIAESKIQIITPGVDTDKFAFTERRQLDTSATADKSRPLKIICTRRMESVFQHNVIIEALKVIKEKGIKFEATFAGDGSMRDNLTQQADNLGLDKEIHFAGKIPNETLSQLLSQHDIYLSASLWDGASLSLLEAMATGVFPIVSDITANSLWLRNGVDGFLHKASDASDLADCIERFLAQPEIALKAAQRNRKIVCEKADRNKNMQKLEEFYKRLVNK